MMVAAITAKISASIHSRVFDFLFLAFFAVEDGLLSVFVAMKFYRVIVLCSVVMSQNDIDKKTFFFVKSLFQYFSEFVKPFFAPNPLGSQKGPFGKALSRKGFVTNHDFIHIRFVLYFMYSFHVAFPSRQNYQFIFLR